MTKFVDLCIDNNYEIGTSYPYVIRRKRDGFLPKEYADSNGYAILWLNKKNYKKHRLIAQQFIENDDPEHKTQVDHINRNKADYHVSNLRWVSNSTNQLNVTGYGDIRYEYVNRLPIDVIPIILYHGNEYDGYFIDQGGNVWFDNGEQYRKLYVQSKDQTVSMRDINHVRHRISIKALVREFL